MQFTGKRKFPFRWSFHLILVYNFELTNKPGKQVWSMVRIKNNINFQPSRLQPIITTKSRCNLILINNTTYSHIYVIVTLFFSLQRTGTYLVINKGQLASLPHTVTHTTTQPPTTSPNCLFSSPSSCRDAVLLLRCLQFRSTVATHRQLTPSITRRPPRVLPCHIRTCSCS